MFDVPLKHGVHNMLATTNNAQKCTNCSTSISPCGGFTNELNHKSNDVNAKPRNGVDNKYEVSMFLSILFRSSNILFELHTLSKAV